jgi:hypothetical protein
MGSINRALAHVPVFQPVHRFSQPFRIHDLTHDASIGANAQLPLSGLTPLAPCVACSMDAVCITKTSEKGNVIGGCSKGLGQAVTLPDVMQKQRGGDTVLRSAYIVTRQPTAPCMHPLMSLGWQRRHGHPPALWRVYWVSVGGFKQAQSTAADCQEG